MLQSEDFKGQIEHIEFDSLRERGKLFVNCRIGEEQASLTVNYTEKSNVIISSLQKQTRSLNLSELEKDSLIKLLLVEAQNIMICDTIKDALKYIEAFDVKKIEALDDYRSNLEFASTPDDQFSAFSDEASKFASILEAKIVASFGRLTERIGKSQHEVFEREQTIEEAKKQLIDNLRKQYVLVVSTKFEALHPKKSGESIFEARNITGPSNEATEMVSKLIDDL